MCESNTLALLILVAGASKEFKHPFEIILCDPASIIADIDPN